MIFISHRTTDKAAAHALRDQLREYGYSEKQLFLDSDADSGIQAGEPWEKALYSHLKRCDALVVICSPRLNESKWCFAEIAYAKLAEKPVFPFYIEACTIDAPIQDLQAVSLHAEGAAAYQRLFRALDQQDLGPMSRLEWAGGRCPYPSLMSFDATFAGVYFGREREYREVLKKLREMRGDGSPRLLMIAGPSGSGKSSLLKAGVLPRLCLKPADQDWIVLPVLRYDEVAGERQETILYDLAEQVRGAFPAGNPCKHGLKPIRGMLAAPEFQDFRDLLRDLATALGKPQATVLLPVDQFEELLASKDDPVAGSFLRLLKGLFSGSNGRLLAIVSIRSDYRDTYWNHPQALKKEEVCYYPLEPFPRERIEDVIRGPAESVDGEISDELLGKLKEATPTEQCLPLLAFTLERLCSTLPEDQVRSGGWKLGYEQYEQIGGVEGAIQHAVDRILKPDETRPQLKVPTAAELDALRLSFTAHLVEVDDKEEYVRRQAPWASLPEAARPFLEEFVDQRLLSSGGSSGAKDGGLAGEEGRTVEITHQAIFHCWVELKGWLDSSRKILRWRRDLRRDPPGRFLWNRLNRRQLAVASDWPQTRGADLLEQEKQWIREATLWRWIGSIGIALVVLIFAGLAGFAFLQYRKAETEKGKALTSAASEKTEKENANRARAEAERNGRLNLAQRLAYESQAKADSAPQQAGRLAAEAIRATAEDDLIVPEAMLATNRVLAREGGRGQGGYSIGGIRSLAFDASEDRVAVLGEWGVEVHDLRKSGPLSLQHISMADENTGPPDESEVVAFDGSGRHLITWKADAEVPYTLWEMTEGKKFFTGSSRLFENDQYDLLVASQDGKLLAAANGSRLWVYDLSDISAGKVVKKLEYQREDPDAGPQGGVSVLEFSRDNCALAWGSTRGWVQIWDLKSEGSKPFRCFSVDSPDGGNFAEVATSLKMIKIADDHQSLVTAGGPAEVGDDRSISAKYWNLAGSRPEASPLSLPSGASLRQLGFLPGSGATCHFVTVSSDGHVSRWTKAGGDQAGGGELAREEIRTHEGEAGIVGAAISPEGTAAVVMDYDGTMTMVDLNLPDAKPIHLQADPPEEVKLAFSPQGKWLVSADGDSIRTWPYEGGHANLLDPTRVGNPRHHYFDCLLSADSSVAALVTRDRIELWGLDGEGGPRPLSSILPKVGNQFKSAEEVMLSGDGSWAAGPYRSSDAVQSAGKHPENSSIRIDLAGSRQFSSNSRWCAAEGPDGIWFLHDLKGTGVRPLELEKSERVEFSPDGCWLLLSGDASQGSSILYDLRGQEPLPQKLSLPTGNANFASAAFSSLSQWLFIPTLGKEEFERKPEDPGGYLWSLELPGKPAREFEIGSFSGFPLGEMIFGPDESWMAGTAGAIREGDGNEDEDLPPPQHWPGPGVKVIYWNPVGDGELKVTDLPGYEKTPGVIEFSPAGNCLLTAGPFRPGEKDLSPRLWKLSAGNFEREPEVLDLEGRSCATVRFSPNGEYLLTVSESGSAESESKANPVLLWRRDPASGRFSLHAPLLRRDSIVTHALFSPDSKWLAMDSAGDSLPCLQFLPASGGAFETIELQTGNGIGQMEFSRDSSALYVSSSDSGPKASGRIYSFGLKPGNLEVAGVKLKLADPSKANGKIVPEKVAGLRLYEFDGGDLGFRLDEDRHRFFVLGAHLHILPLPDRKELTSRLGALAGSNLSWDEWKLSGFSDPYHKTFEEFPIPLGVLSELGSRIGIDDDPQGPPRRQVVDWAIELGLPHMTAEVAANLAQQKEGELALRAIEAALNDSPDHADYRFIRCVARAQLGRYEGARDDFDFAVKQTSPLLERVKEAELEEGRKDALSQWYDDLKAGRNPFAKTVPTLTTPGP